MTQDLPLACLDERYGRLRLAHPAAERAVRDSMSQLGQLMPLVACPRGPVFAVVDGFKRVAAARALGATSLRTQVMPLSETAAMSSLLSFNRARRGACDLEEALVVRALSREEGLLLAEIAELCGRDKSWVSRRLMLAERLADEVAADVRAGLLSATAAREVARLPRGNQGEVATSIHQHALTSREVTALIARLRTSPPESEQRRLLEDPRAALGAQPPPTAFDPRLGQAAQALWRSLQTTAERCAEVERRLDHTPHADWSLVERDALRTPLSKLRASAERLLARLPALGLDEVRRAS